MAEKSLYERLSGVFAIATVVDHFSDAVVKNREVGQGSPNKALDEWSTQELDRLPGLKFMRTLWLCEAAGGPFTFAPTKPGRTHLGLEEAHRELRIAPISSTRSRPNSAVASTPSRFRRGKRVRYSRRSPHARAKSRKERYRSPNQSALGSTAIAASPEHGMPSARPSRAQGSTSARGLACRWCCTTEPGANVSSRSAGRGGPLAASGWRPMR